MIKPIAFYLPQYHPIPENDEWWGKGFTEWTNSSKARPLFPGHYQPHIPADLGFYDLRLEQSRIDQAILAKEYGIFGFCYYHYWFNGRVILNNPLNDFLRSKKPDFPFCLCWANETWSGVWHGLDKKILIQQTYPGVEDYKNHFLHLLPSFSDPRYIRHDGKPVFLIYKYKQIPNPEEMISVWQKLAQKHKIEGIHFIAISDDLGEDPMIHGFDSVIYQRISPRAKLSNVAYFKYLPIQVLCKLLKLPTVYLYKDSIPELIPKDWPNQNWIPCAVPNWDNTARSGRRGLVLHNSTPDLFAEHYTQACRIANNSDTGFVFIKSWNEWAEGNHLEPDIKYGRAYLEVVKEITQCQNGSASNESAER